MGGIVGPQNRHISAISVCLIIAAIFFSTLAPPLGFVMIVVGLLVQRQKSRKVRRADRAAYEAALAKAQERRRRKFIAAARSLNR